MLTLHLAREVVYGCCPLGFDKLVSCLLLAGLGTCFYAYFLLKKLVSGLLPTGGEGGLHEYSPLGVWLGFYGYFPLGNGYFIKINRKKKEKYMKKKKKNKANG